MSAQARFKAPVLHPVRNVRGRDQAASRYSIGACFAGSGPTPRPRCSASGSKRIGVN